MYVYLVGLNTVPGGTVFEVDVVHFLCVCAFGPVDCLLIIVVDKCRSGTVWEVHVVAWITKG